MRILLQSILILFMASLPVAAQVNDGNSAANSHNSVSDVFVFGTGELWTPASSTLSRSTNAVSMTFDTIGLNDGEVYTVWWAIFNEPQRCSSAPCSVADLLDNPSVNPSLAWATGRVVHDPYGQAAFSAHLVPGSPEGEVLFGPGLVNPLKAEIHAVLRTHGEASGDMGTLMEQLTTFGGGCGDPPGFEGCANVQFSIHRR